MLIHKQLLNNGTSHKVILGDKDWIVKDIPLILVDSVIIGEYQMEIIVESILLNSKSVDVHLYGEEPGSL